MTQTLAWSARAVVLLPVLAALVGVCVPRGRRGVLAAVAVGGTALALAAATAQVVAAAQTPALSDLTFLGSLPGGRGTLHLTVRADRLSAVLALMVTLVSLCVQVYSVAYQADDRRYRAYAATVSLFTAAMLLVVQSDDLLLLLIGWEGMGLCSYLLVGHESERRVARAAAVKAFLVTRVGDVGFLLGIVVLWVATGTTSISTLLRPATLEALGAGTSTTAVLLLMVGVLGKSAQFPLHTWLPDAMAGPTPVSALIHAATMVAAGGAVLARLLPLLLAAPAARACLAVLTAITMLGAALAACVQSDLKRVLAWSTISQVAYLLAALAVAPAALGVAPAMVQLLSHAGFKALLFLSAGALAHQVHSTALGDLAGAGRRAPLIAGLFTLGLASLAGVPPLSGFWSKEAVLGAAEQTAFGAGPHRWTAWLVLGCGVLTGAVTAAYCARTWWLVVRETPAAAQADLVAVEAVQSPSPHQTAIPVAPVPANMAVPLLVLAVPSALGGLLLLDPVVPGRVQVGVPLASFAGVLALLAVVSVLLLARRRGDPASVLGPRLTRLLASGWGVDRAQDALVVRPVRALARVVSRGDVDVVDAYPRAAAVLSRWAGTVLGRTQTGSATGYLTWLVAGALVAAVAGMGLR